MNRFAHVCLMLLLTFGLACTAGAFTIDLYSAEENQLFGTTANGKARSQMFSPTQSTPNALTAADYFTQAGFRIDLGAGEVLSFGLYLKPWLQDSYAVSDAATAIAFKAFNLSGPGTTWCMLDPFTAQPATGQYLLQIKNVNLNAGDWGLLKSNTDDGGPNNIAWNDGTAQTNREYQVRLEYAPVPEPGTLSVLGLGLLALIRRKRS